MQVSASQSPNHRSSNWTPRPLKSSVLRVTLVRSGSFAVAAIIAWRSERRFGTCIAAQRVAVDPVNGKTCEENSSSIPRSQERGVWLRGESFRSVRQDAYL
jgi:hypothetical protein